MESILAFFAKHWVGKPPEIPQLFAGHFSKRVNVAQDIHIQRGHRIHTQHPQSCHAKMHALHGVVTESIRPERASIAHSVTQDAPRVAKVVAILPEYARHFEVMVRLFFSDPEGAPAY